VISNFSPVYSLGESDPKCYIITAQNSWSGMDDMDIGDDGDARLMIETHLDFILPRRNSKPSMQYIQ
jgi:hypothetical protein